MRLGKSEAVRSTDGAIAGTDDPALAATYASLACGSRNHLRAFTSQLASAGAAYAPQYLDPADYDAILASPHESCGSEGRSARAGGAHGHHGPFVGAPGRRHNRDVARRETEQGFRER